MDKEEVRNWLSQMHDHTLDNPAGSAFAEASQDWFAERLELPRDDDRVVMATAIGMQLVYIKYLEDVVIDMKVDLTMAEGFMKELGLEE